MLNKNITIKRGDLTSIVLIIDGDRSQDVLSFVVKELLDLTADRLIEKAGNLITAVYNSEANRTIITISLLDEDTADLEAKKYYWDLVSTDDKTTIAGGEFVLVADVQTPFDGFALPESAVRFQQVDATNGAVNDIAIIKEVDGVKYYEFISPADYAAILKPILDNL